LKTLKLIERILRSFTWTIFAGEVIKWTFILGSIVIVGSAILEEVFSINTFVFDNEGMALRLFVGYFILIALVVEGIIGVYEEFHPSEWSKSYDRLNEIILKKMRKEDELKDLLEKKSTIRIFSGTECEAIQQYERYLKEHTKKEPRIDGIVSCASPVVNKTGEEYTVSMVCDVWELKDAAKEGEYRSLEARINEYDLWIGDLEKVVCGTE